MRVEVGRGASPVDRATAATRVARASRWRPSEAAARMRPPTGVSDGLVAMFCRVQVPGWMPRSMGRANRINHRTSHLTVVVTDEK